MSVLTPAFPCMNSSHMVTECSFAILKKFFEEGAEIIDRINRQEARWHDLFQEFDFAKTYNNFIEVDVVGEDEEEFKRWKGLIESRIRKMGVNFGQPIQIDRGSLES